MHVSFSQQEGHLPQATGATRVAQKATKLGLS